jgi:hypothetical protein
VSQQINLFNPIFLKQKKYFSTVAMAQALGLLLAGSICLGVYTNFQSRSLEAQAVNTSSQLVEAQAQLAKVSAAAAARQKSKSLEEEIQKADGDVKSLQQILDLLQKGDFGNTKGYAEYLRAFSRQIAEGIWLTGFGIFGAGSEIGIQGRALRPESVPSFINRLKREPVLRGKSFSALAMQTPMVEQTVKTATGVSKSMVQAGYIDFNLKSSELGMDRSEMAGAKSR